MTAKELGYAFFCKQAGLFDTIQTVGETAANLSINTDKTNKELDRKIDMLINAADNTPDAKKKKKKEHSVRIVGADDAAKEQLKGKKHLISNVIAKLREEGVI